MTGVGNVKERTDPRTGSCSDTCTCSTSYTRQRKLYYPENTPYTYETRYLNTSSALRNKACATWHLPGTATVRRVRVAAMASLEDSGLGGAGVSSLSVTASGAYSRVARRLFSFTTNLARWSSLTSQVSEHSGYHVRVARLLKWFQGSNS